MKYSIFPLIGTIFLFTVCHNRQNTIKETHINETGLGYALPEFDNRLTQSPVNILSSGTEKVTGHEGRLVFNEGITAIENSGHSVQLDFSEGATSIINDMPCQAKQLHFHTPSEHLIDGITYPMEMHVVNILKTHAGGKKLAYIVVGILFKMGHENKFLDDFLKTIPHEPHSKETLEPGTVKLEDLFDGIPKNEWGKYENVDWILSKYIFEASPEQITTIEKIEGDNARHVQALNSRKVSSN